MKGNVMIRMISFMIWGPILLAHFTGQIDLSHAYWIWLTLFAGANAFQATFTGFCPVSRFMPKDPETGACCVSDTSGTCCSGTEEKASAEPSACCSGGGCNAETTDDGSSNNDALDIKVLGTGCATCVATGKLIEKLASEKGVAVRVIKVEDVAEIAQYGVMSTPGIVIAEAVVHSGGMPSAEQVESWLK